MSGTGSSTPITLWRRVPLLTDLRQLDTEIPVSVTLCSLEGDIVTLTTPCL